MSFSIPTELFIDLVNVMINLMVVLVFIRMFSAIITKLTEALEIK